MIDEESKLNEEEVLMLISSVLESVVNNDNYFYRSNVAPQYSSIHPAGEEMLIKSMRALLPLLAEAKQDKLKKIAKQLTLDSLK
jgi:predicted metal-dependent hydrolase